MKISTLHRSSIAIVLLLLPLSLMLTSCGSPIADAQGCPSGSYLANSTDKITGPADVAYTGVSYFNGPYPGGSVNFTPLTFLVTDSKGVPRNNVCLQAYTGDPAASPGPYWYTDATYSIPVWGTGPFNARVLVTDDTGVATAYWSTASLPRAITKTLTSAAGVTPPTYTAGADQKSESYVQIQSGSAATVFFKVNWTVKGEPAL